jgi:hypothetical protein
MKMTTTTSKIALGLFSAVLATALMPASAAGWKVWEGHNEAAPRAILTDTSDRAGAVLVCDPIGNMSAILSMEAGSISDQLDIHATYKRGETALISAGNESALETTVRYSPANSVIEIESHTPAARIYNSAIRGVPVMISVEHAGKVETLLPKPDQTFRAFAKTCNAARMTNAK